MQRGMELGKALARGSVMNVELAGKRVGYERGIGKQEGRL